MKTGPLINFLAATACLLLTACAMERPPELVQTESRFATLDAALPPGSPGRPALEQAREELDYAEDEWLSDGSGPDLNHYLYLTNRRMDMAQAQQRIMVARDTESQIMRSSVLGTVGRARLGEKTARAEAESYRAELRGLQQQMNSMPLQETVRGTEFAMTNVMFDLNSSNLRPGAERRLSALADFLRRHPDQAVTIEGYADSTGPSSYNERLSLARAESVKSVLTGQGVDTRRITTRGLGEAYPLASNTGEAGRLQNRSVLIIVNPPPGGETR